MTDTDRLAALREPLIRAVAALDGYENPNTEPGGWWDRRCAPVLAVVAQGVRVGDDGPTILDAWRVLEREYPEAIVARLRAALAVPPAPTLDRERLARALFRCSVGCEGHGDSTRHQTSDHREDAAAIADAYEVL